jgi:hypothetical protein
MKKFLFCLLCIWVSISAFANGSANPLLGKWNVFPQFVLTGGKCMIAGGGSESWEFKEDGTLIVDGEVTITYKLSSEGDYFTINVDENTMDVYYYVVNDDVISLALYVKEDDQYNVAVCTRVQD